MRPPVQGKASVLAPTGAVLASGHYSMAQGAKEPVVLTLSTNGARALAQAWNHPVGEKLLVTVSRGVAATSMVQVSWGGDSLGGLGAMIAGGGCRHNS